MQNEEDITEEDVYIFTEFDENLPIDNYNNVHILGIDTPHPIIQIDDSIFKGTYELPIGTHMFFEEDNKPQCLDPVFDALPEKSFKYLCKSNKTLKLEHSFIQMKSDTDAVPNKEEKEVKDTVTVPEFHGLEHALRTIRQKLQNDAQQNDDDR